MEESKDTKNITGKFIGKYIFLAIIIGGISFFLENLIPELLHWELDATRAVSYTHLKQYTWGQN